MELNFIHVEAIVCNFARAIGRNLTSGAIVCLFKAFYTACTYSAIANDMSVRIAVDFDDDEYGVRHLA